MAKEYTNPVEKAYEEGRGTITQEEAVSLKGGTPKKQKKVVKTETPKRGPEWDEDFVDRVARKLKELYYGEKMPKSQKQLDVEAKITKKKK